MEALLTKTVSYHTNVVHIFAPMTQNNKIGNFYTTIQKNCCKVSPPYGIRFKNCYEIFGRTREAQSRVGDWF